MGYYSAKKIYLCALPLSLLATLLIYGTIELENNGTHFLLVAQLCPTSG